MTVHCIRCVVADDHPPVVDAVSRCLAARGIDVVGSAGDSEAALAMIERLHPDVALVDIHMPGIGGMEVARRLGRTAPRTGLVLYTGDGSGTLLREALDAGARGILSKAAPLADVVRAIETVAHGSTYLDPVLARVPAAELLGPDLTTRERDVMRLVADGLTNEEIGRRLFISSETVRAHTRRATTKLGARTRTQAVAISVRGGLIA